MACDDTNLYLTENTVYVSQSSTGVNTLTKAAVSGQRWRLKTVEVCVSGPTVWVGGGTVTIKDGTTTIWQEYLEQGVGSVGHRYAVNLPECGLVGTAGDLMSIAVSDPGGSLSTIINAEFQPA